MMRNIILGLTILVVIFTGCKSKSYDFSAVCESGQTLYYKITSNEEPYTVDIVRQNINEPYYDNNPIGNLVIPETVLYNGITYSVRAIGNNAFSNSSNLASVSLPKTITSIKDSAFYMCSGIREIVIPNSVTYVGRKAFYGCDSIESVALLYSEPKLLYRDSHRQVENNECSFCYYDDVYLSNSSTIRMLESIFTKEPSQYKLVISNDITSIPDYAFKDCNIFSSIEIPYSVTSIGNCAFKDCYNLTSFSIPASVTSIGNSAFEGTGWYRNQSDGIVYLDNWCLGYKTTIAVTGTWGEHSYTIYKNVPNREKPIGTITIQEGTKGIADGVFCYRTRIKSLIVPNSVKYIGKCAFDGCEGLASVSIGEAVEIIDSSAFRNCYSLKSLILPNSVTCIGDDAFSCYPKYDNSGEIIDYGCNELKTLTIPNSVKSIGESAFSGRSRLTSVIIGNSVEIIGAYAFSNCSELTSIIIPNSVANIGIGAFSDCSGLKDIEVDSHNPIYDSREDCNAIIETSTNKLLAGCTNTVIPNSVTCISYGAFCGCKGLKSITIPNSVTNIDSIAFSGCSALTSVTIPNSITEICYKVFKDCSGLTSITIPNSVTQIGSLAFYGCSRLTSVTIPNSVKSIGSWAFYGCGGLTSIIIPNSVTNIGFCAFSDCSGLKGIEVDSCNPIYDSRDDCNAIIETSTNKLLIGCSNTVIPNSVASIGDCAFKGCSGLTGTLTIPDSVTKIDNYAFEGCSGLTSISIPNSVTKIGCGAFKGCRSLSSITIPNSATSIGSDAFSGCIALTSVTIPNSVTSIGNSAFRDCKSLPKATIKKIRDINYDGYYDSDSKVDTGDPSD